MALSHRARVSPLKAAIAGAGRGIGAACARALAAAGWQVVLCARTASEVEAVARETGGRACVADLSTDKGALAFAAFAGPVDLAIVSVGSAHPLVPAVSATRAQWTDAFEGNAIAPALCGAALARAGARHLLFLSSLATRRPPVPGAAPYTAAKAALEAIVRAFSEEGVRCNALCLGAVRTRMHEEAGTPAELRAQFPAPDEIAPLVLAAAQVTGSGRILDADALALSLRSAESLRDQRAGGEARAEALPSGQRGARAAVPSFPAAGQRDARADAPPSPLGGRGPGGWGWGAPQARESEAREAASPDAIGAAWIELEVEAACAGDGRLALVEKMDEPEAEAEPGRRPSPRVLRAIRESAASGGRYPRGAESLRERLAALHGVSPDCISLSGGGATELIERSLRIFCPRGDEVASPFPTFEVLSALALREGVRHRPIPAERTPDGLFAPHSCARIERGLGPRTRLIYVASPDNPTGALLADPTFSLPAIVDEAWSLEAPRRLRDGAIHLRSFSKLHGLAGLRVAYAVGPRALLALYRKLELPFPLGAPQLAAVNAVLDEPERTRRAALLLVRERARVAVELRALGLAVNESPAPILLLRSPHAGRIAFALRARGLAMQEAHWDAQSLVLALGRRADNDRALAAIAQALPAR